MQIELSTYDILVLITLCLGYAAKHYYDYTNVPRSYQDDGPWSPFGEEQTNEKGKKEYTEPAPSITDSSGDISSPAETPVPSEVDRYKRPVLLPETPTPPSTRSSSQLSTSTSEDSHDDALVPSNVFVSHILTNDLLYDLVLLPADPCTLVRLARTCRTAHSAVQSHITRTFNINTHLSRYFSDPLAFRSLQAKTGTLISGSNALQFLDRSFYPEADLDLYSFYEARAEVGTWLMRQGYRFAPNSRQDPSFRVAVTQARIPGTDAALSPYSRMKSVSAVYTFVKRVDNLEGPSTRLKVQIIVAYNSPMDAIFHFHSTAVLNVISYSHAYSLYPRATFHDRVALALIPRSMLESSVEAKYSQRGWRFIHSVPSLPPPDFVSPLTGQVILQYVRAGECNQCAHCQRRRAEEASIIRAFPTSLRWIGDKHSWVLPLNTDGVRLPTRLGDSLDSTPMSRDPSFITSWEMIERRPRNGETGKKIKARVLTGDGFWYAYVISDPKLKKAMAMIQEFCDEELVEYCKDMLEDRKLWDDWYPS